MPKKPKPQHNPYKRVARLQRFRDDLEKLELVTSRRQLRGEAASLARLAAELADLKRTVAIMKRALALQPASRPRSHRAPAHRVGTGFSPR